MRSLQVHSGSCSSLIWTVTIWRKVNTIKSLINGNGEVKSTLEEMCNIVHDYFSELFQKKPSSRDRVLQAISTSTSDENNNMLTMPFIFEEFKEAIFSMNGDKSPGPDGYNPNFYKHFWDLCGNEIYHGSCFWLESGSFPPNLNMTNCSGLGPAGPKAMVKAQSKRSCEGSRRSKEGLSALIKKSEARGDVHGVKICKNSPIISHLLFADDCFLFFKVNSNEATEMKNILSTYEEASDQAINLQKSEFFCSRNVTPENKNSLADILGINKF
ncbi:unnamed protein product [Vicia faba]|uniref:Reverse transcriptase n=1 Tax=Vicia faba TaxID=3906 RepID=A0AAV1APK8_VICFA|nr:unnamed protein product [Vicia faba]